MIEKILQEHAETLNRVIKQLVPDIETACAMVKQTLTAGHKILLAGNGGSAADAQHIATEFSGRFVKERRALPAIALTTDTSALTAISNDYGFERVFSRQVEALARENDLFIGLSTSGNSPNILEAFKVARSLGCKTLGMSGRSGGEMQELCDLNIVVPSEVTARIQEMHILIGHILCESADQLF
ncbi:MAG: D-sedoheptulose 7-phosphate isomerase [Mucilaginibacter polytrichastri]|nr:D-sedoheptulose 7-phosphate isomerase [Mucilaginibacter polytrichastri]